LSSSLDDYSSVAVTLFQTYDNVAHIPPPPDEEYFLMSFFGFLVVGLYFLGKIAKRSRT